MARVVSGFAHPRTEFYACRMAAMRSLSMADTAPHQSDAGQKQQPEHDVTKIPVAQAVIDSRAGPGAEYRSGESDQRQPERLPV